MVRAAYTADTQLTVIHPRLGTGWETTVNDLTREICLRFRLLGLPLPIKKIMPFSEVAHVSVVSRESWWSAPTERWESCMGNPEQTVTEMPTKGWRYDLLMTEKGGRTTRLEVLKSRGTANELAGQLRRRVGLPSVY